MNNTFYLKIVDHIGKIETSEIQIYKWFKRNFNIIEAVESLEKEPDFMITVKSGYGDKVDNYDVEMTQNEQINIFRRMDYLMETNLDYSAVNLSVYNLFALKHAMMNFYSSFIIQRNWGLLIHSSCIIQDEKAFLFSGHSGAGKSTVALLSEPRMVYSDEATLIYFKENLPYVVDSPFRSDSISKFYDQMYPLAGVYLLHQSDLIELKPIKSSEGLMLMTDKIFYWAHNTQETKNVFNMLRHIMADVPAYELHFQKNNEFWEMIS